MTNRHHSEEAKRVLQKASLSTESELTDDERARLQEAVELVAANPRISGDTIRKFIIPPPSHEATSEAGAEGDPIMAKTATTTKRRGRPARPELTKAQVAKLAKLRRDGATWADVDVEADQHRSSTGWRILFNEHGFEKDGTKQGSNQASKARAWGSANGNGDAPKAKATKRVKKTKATAKK
jgi:hypothetical protein